MTQPSQKTNWQAARRKLMESAGVNIDKPLEIDWDRTPDIRDNRDPHNVYRQLKVERVRNQ